MNTEQIKKMVVEAGWSGLYTEFNEPDGSPGWKMVKKSLTVPVTFEQVEKFVSIVRAATKDEDAKICDVYEQRFKEQASKNDGRQSDMAFGRIVASAELADSIRASK